MDCGYCLNLEPGRLAPSPQSLGCPYGAELSTITSLVYSKLVLRNPLRTGRRFLIQRNLNLVPHSNSGGTGALFLISRGYL